MKRLLLIEENPGTHDIFQELLYDWVLLPAFSPKQAEKILSEEQELEDLVLMVDIDLIRNMEVDWLNRLWTGYPDVPIVLLTQSETDPVVQRAYEAGVKACLIRPFYEKELRSALETAR